MTLIVVLFVAGVVLLALEVVVPGGVLGIIGGLSILGGVVLAFTQFGFDGGLYATLAALALLAVALYFEFVLLPKSRVVKTFSMSATSAGQSQPAIADRSIIGKRVVAVTPLTPSGVVEFDGRRLEAFARSGHARPGEQLDIVDIDNFRLIVTKPSTNQTK
jgi:membrane-bound ClpP family serine protease